MKSAPLVTIFSPACNPLTTWTKLPFGQAELDPAQLERLVIGGDPDPGDVAFVDDRLARSSRRCLLVAAEDGDAREHLRLDQPFRILDRRPQASGIRVHCDRNVVEFPAENMLGGRQHPDWTGWPGRILRTSLSLTFATSQTVDRSPITKTGSPVGSLAPLVRSLSHANRVSDRSFPRSGETVFGLPETEGPELPLKRSFFPAEIASRLCAPQKPGVFVKPREISVSVGLRGGPGRTRTSNQPVMDSVSRSLASIFASDTRKQNKKMIAERTGILPRTER